MRTESSRRGHRYLPYAAALAVVVIGPTACRTHPGPCTSDEECLAIYGNDEHGRPRAICDPKHSVCVQPEFADPVPDAGNVVDAGETPDAGEPTDAGATPDAGEESDAGEPPELPDGGALPLSVTIASPASNAYTNFAITFSISVTGRPDEVELLKDGVLIAKLGKPYRYTWNVSNVSEGDHLFHARALKGSEQRLSESRVIRVDRTAPKIIARSPEANRTDVKATKVLRIDFSEPLLKASITSTSFSVSNQSVTVKPSMDGLWLELALAPGITGGHVVTVNSRFGPTDLAGNLLLESSWQFELPLLLPDGPPLATSTDPNGIKDPAILIDAAGEYIAFAEYVNGEFNIRVKGGPAWSDLGSPLNGYPGNGTNASSPTLIRGPSGRPIIAFDERNSVGETSVLAYEWTGTSWTPVSPSPGVGSVPQLAVAKGTLYRQGGTPYLSEWTGFAWNNILPPISIAGQTTTVCGGTTLHFFGAGSNANGSYPVGYALQSGFVTWSDLGIPQTQSSRPYQVLSVADITAASFAPGELTVAWVSTLKESAKAGSTIVTLGQYSGGSWQPWSFAPYIGSVYQRSPSIALNSNSSGVWVAYEDYIPFRFGSIPVITIASFNGTWGYLSRLHLGQYVRSSQPRAARGMDGRLRLVAVEGENTKSIVFYSENR